LYEAQQQKHETQNLSRPSTVIATQEECDGTKVQLNLQTSSVFLLTTQNVSSPGVVVDKSKEQVARTRERKKETPKIEEPVAQREERPKKIVQPVQPQEYNGKINFAAVRGVPVRLPEDFPTSFSFTSETGFPVKTSLSLLGASVEIPNSATPFVIFVNGTKHTLDTVDPTMTLNAFLRSLPGLKGTKKSCGEGGCGACTVVLGDPGEAAPKSVNSCLRPLVACYGKSVTTVEGLGSQRKGYHPIQVRRYFLIAGTEPNSMMNFLLGNCPFSFLWTTIKFSCVFPFYFSPLPAFLITSQSRRWNLIRILFSLKFYFLIIYFPASRSFNFPGPLSRGRRNQCGFCSP
jgi:hypothetical protein